MSADQPPRHPVRRLLRWLSERWDGPKQAEEFLAKPLPRNISWLHSLGALLLVYLGFQVLTGILLGFYYSTSTQTAYASMQYVREELFLGRFLHQLHRYGVGFVLVTAFLHLARSFFLAAYKPPRELLWLAGLALFGVLTLFAFTGQLLPYDQRGYWATVVGIEIASSAPGVGEGMRDLLTGGYGTIGETTLSRFYVLHVSVLPIVLIGLIGLHLRILQKVGSAGPASGSPDPKRRFYPSQAIKDVVVCSLGAAALCATAALLSTELTAPADPSAAGFIPRPEWYFLAHYEILRVLPGRWQILGTVVLPGVLGGALVLLPFVDRSPNRALKQRPIWTAGGLVVCLSVVGLTVTGLMNIQREEAAAAAPEADGSGDPVQLGRELFGRKDCTKCHQIAGEGGTEGPDLTHVGRRLRPEYLPQWIRNPRSFKPDTQMPAFEGSEAELNAVVEYLLSLD